MRHRDANPCTLFTTLAGVASRLLLSSGLTVHLGSFPSWPSPDRRSCGYSAATLREPRRCRSTKRASVAAARPLDFHCHQRLLTCLCGKQTDTRARLRGLTATWTAVCGAPCCICRKAKVFTVYNKAGNRRAPALDSLASDASVYRPSLRLAWSRWWIMAPVDGYIICRHASSLLNLARYFLAALAEPAHIATHHGDIWQPVKVRLSSPSPTKLIISPRQPCQPCQSISSETVQD